MSKNGIGTSQPFFSDNEINRFSPISKQLINRKITKEAAFDLLGRDIAIVRRFQLFHNALCDQMRELGEIEEHMRKLALEEESRKELEQLERAKHEQEGRPKALDREILANRECTIAKIMSYSDEIEVNGKKVLKGLPEEIKRKFIEEIVIANEEKAAEIAMVEYETAKQMAALDEEFRRATQPAKAAPIRSVQRSSPLTSESRSKQPTQGYSAHSSQSNLSAPRQSPSLSQSTASSSAKPSPIMIFSWATGTFVPVSANAEVAKASASPSTSVELPAKPLLPSPLSSKPVADDKPQLLAKEAIAHSLRRASANSSPDVHSSAQPVTPATFTKLSTDSSAKSLSKASTSTQSCSKPASPSASSQKPSAIQALAKPSLSTRSSTPSDVMCANKPGLLAKAAAAHPLARASASTTINEEAQDPKMAGSQKAYKPK